ncbi:MAG: lipoprotein signal peptidase [Proteobacteria bacterium]|nr:lipoprotein signal peptidase [Pseudomonadota bacterium]
MIVVYFALILCTIVLDQLTKAWIVDSLRLYESVEIVPGFFNLVHVTNSGAAFSLLADVDSPWRHYFFLSIGSLAMVGLTVAYLKLRKVNKYYSLALALIAGGAAGNLIDRIRFGAVIDFLDLYVGRYHWPAFNVADSAICVGAGLFLVLNIFEVRNQEEKEPQ